MLVCESVLCQLTVSGPPIRPLSFLRASPIPPPTTCRNKNLSPFQNLEDLMQEFPDFATRVLRMASEHLRRDRNRGIDVSQVRLRPVIADVLTRPQGVNKSARGSTLSSPTGGSGPVGGSSFAITKNQSTGAPPAGGSRRGSTSSDREALAEARLESAQQASSMDTILKELAAVRGDLRDLRRNSGAQRYVEPPSKEGGRAFNASELPSDFKPGNSPQSPAPASLPTGVTSPSNVPEARAKNAPSPSYQKNTANIFG